MAFTTITITQDYDLSDGTDPSGTVTFTPSAPFVNGGVLVPQVPVARRLDVDGLLTVQLFANTDAGTAPAGTSYRVDEDLSGIKRVYYVTVPHDAGSSLTLSSLASVAVAPALSFPSQTYTAVTVDGLFVPTYAIDSTPIGPEDLAGVVQTNAPVGGVLTATAVTNAGASNADVTAWGISTPAFVAPAFTNQAGRYGFTASPGAVSTSATLTNGTLRLTPWIVPFACTIDKIGAECTATGDSGSKLRIGIYSDNGHCYPGALLLDAGQIAGDSATVQDITLGSSQAIPAGLYWIGGAEQSTVTTQPTWRITNNIHAVGVPLLTTSTTPAAGATTVGYAQTGVTGALGTPFSSTITATGSAPRIHVRYV